MSKKSLNFLIIRRDNIGDLLCVTPAIHALRKKHPNAKITFFSNSYNAPILNNNPDIDNIETYTKAKHRNTSQSFLSVSFHKVRLIIKLRKENFDYIIIASGVKKRDWNLAKWMNPACIIGYANDSIKLRKYDIGLNVYNESQHEVERVFNLFSFFEVGLPIPSMQLFPNKIKKNQDIKGGSLIIGLHISARKVKQRWPIENFYNLIKHLNNKFSVNFLIFWSPGSDDNACHPGDDNKAQQLIELCQKFPVTPYPTRSLEELSSGLQDCHYVFCSDGGGMHIAAALKKPVVCFFGNSNAEQWYPWGVDYRLIQPSSKNVEDISVIEAVNAFESLAASGIKLKNDVDAL